MVPILLAEASWFSLIMNTFVILTSLLLIFVVLIQRGKGGGLAGAFGGAGGSSPFGSRAGDTFTKITLYMALFWVILIMIHVRVAGKYDSGSASQGGTPTGESQREIPE